MKSEAKAPQGRPLLSIVIPTLNSEETLERCLQSITSQEFRRADYEIIIADAGSCDRTLEIARACGVDRIVENPLQSGEAGKSAGIKVACGEFIALIDSDNLLPQADWLARMLQPFEDREIVASDPIAWSVRAQDAALTRYFSMAGICDPLCLFVGNYDKHSAITGTWTGLQVPSEDCGDYLKLTLAPDALPTIGANGYIFRRALLEHITWEPYYFDIDVVHQAILAGFPHVAKVKIPIVHLYCARLSEFARKQKRRIRDFLYFAKTRQRSYPWRAQSRWGVLLFCLATTLTLPMLWQMAVGYRRRADRAWFYHLPVCWITLWIYGWAVLRRMLGFKQAPMQRGQWQVK